jgi:peptide deformylase
MPAEPLSRTARSLGIVQAGAAILHRAAAPFDLPGDAAEAARILDLLTTTLDRFAAAHNFRSGLGLSAPQLGIPRAAVAIRAAHGEQHALLNPRIIAHSADTDEDYEGCLSCYDHRGLVIRPLTLDIEHQDLDGHHAVIGLPHGVARLAAHEIDHLRGILYTDRMRPGVAPIPVRRYGSAR